MKHSSGEILIKNGHTIVLPAYTIRGAHRKDRGRRLFVASVLLSAVGAPDGGQPPSWRKYICHSLLKAAPGVFLLFMESQTMPWCAVT